MMENEQEFWIVWISEARVTKAFASQHEAIIEAERLARSESSKSFYVMRAESVSKSVSVQTTPMRPRV